jgi:hypothetical protein
MMILGLIAWILAIIVMIYQTLLDFKTGMLNRKVTNIGIALTGIVLAAAESIIDSSLVPLVLSLVTGITAYYFFKYTVYRMGLIGGGDVRVMYSLGFMFPTFTEVPFLTNNKYLFGIKETWPYLSMYFNLIIIAGFFVIFETLVDCWRSDKIKIANPDIRYLAASLLFFIISTAAVLIPASAGALGQGTEPDTSVNITNIVDSNRFNHLVRALIIISSFVMGLFFLKRFSKDLLRKKLKFRDLPAVGHQILSSQYVVEVQAAHPLKQGLKQTEIRAVSSAEIKELKRQMKRNDKGEGIEREGKDWYNIIVEKNTVIPIGVARKLASLAPDAEIEIKTAKPRTVYLLFMVILLPLGDLFTIMNKIIIGW